MNFEKAYNSVVDKLEGWLNTFITMLPNIVVAVLVLIAFFILGRILKKIFVKLLDKVSSLTSVNKLVSKIIFFVIISIGFFISLGILNLDKALTSLLAGVGIVGLALGFAFQDMAANFMAGIAIAFRRPFRVEDIIETNDYFGTVKKINLRTTEMLTPQGQMVLIPNKEIFQNPIVNFNETGLRRVDLEVGVSYGDDLEKVKQITLDACQDIHNQVDDKEVEVFYEEFGSSSINFVVRIWIRYISNKDYVWAMSDAVMKIKKAFDENDITIPFPIRTLDFGIKGGEKLTEMTEGKPLSIKTN